MKTIFIAYADEKMAWSLKRIGRQAKRLGIFDEIVLWTPDMLPQYVKDSPLMQYARGGGYWAWKPAIIHETLQAHEEGDIVVYVDAGCTLRKSFAWEMIFRLMKQYDTVCFQYDETVPLFAKWGQSSTRIKHWTKKSALDFLDGYLGDADYHENCKIFGSVLFVKGKQNQLVSKWLDITLHHPEVIVDPTEEERAEQPEGFAYHKHDQSIITALAFYDKTLLALPETIENYTPDSFVWASRMRAKNWGDGIAFGVKRTMRATIGERAYNFVKRCRQRVK